MKSPLHFVLLVGLLNAVPTRAQAGAREDAARAELERQLQELVQRPAPEVDIIFEGLGLPHLQLVEAEFLLDDKPLPQLPLEELSRPGPHRLRRLPVEEGTHTLESRAVYLDSSPVFQSSLSGFRWRVASRVTFHAQRGLRMRVRAIPGQVPEAAEPHDRMKLVHEVVPEMLAPVAAPEPPPARPSAPVKVATTVEEPRHTTPAVPATLLLEVSAGKKPVAATVRVRGAVSREVSTKGTRGPREVELAPGTYAVEVIAPGFLAQTRVVSLESRARVLVGFTLARAPRKPGLRVKDGRLELTPALQFLEGAIVPAKPTDTMVALLVDAMVRQGIKRLRVEGHADNQEHEGDALSAARARALAEALERAGLARERVESVGFGDSRPVAPNITSRGRQLNRRVDLRVLER
ncbi:MAG: OmpA family protein [Myxococcaceae bacterium]|nr:OmpA family protein [Myxococcaceae bacterium]MCI0671572.1 OmpA family protein [Myxococcaceae bacterium]